jgi:hypothetical protein
MYKDYIESINPVKGVDFSDIERLSFEETLQYRKRIGLTNLKNVYSLTLIVILMAITNFINYINK